MFLSLLFACVQLLNFILLFIYVHSVCIRSVNNYSCYIVLFFLHLFHFPPNPVFYIVLYLLCQLYNEGIDFSIIDSSQNMLYIVAWPLLALQNPRSRWN